MAVQAGLAQLSDTMFTTAIAVYALAMVAFTAEFAFGRRHRRVELTPIVVRRVPETVGASGASSRSEGSDGSDQPETVGPLGSTRSSNGAGQLAVVLTVAGALVHAGSLAVRGAAVDRVPWGNMYEFSVVVGLMAVVAFLAVLWRAPQIRYLGAVVMLPVIVVMFLAGTVLYTRASPLVPALQSYWLAIHVSAAATAEGVLLTSAVLTGLFLVRDRYERRPATIVSGGRLVSLAQRLPAAVVLDKVAYRIVVFAFPLYTFGVIAGAIWAEAAWGRYWGWDPKETWAFIAWVIYAAYLHARATAGWRGRNAAYINLLGFAAMTFNFFVVNVVISGLHSYAGLN